MGNSLGNAWTAISKSITPTCAAAQAQLEAAGAPSASSCGRLPLDAFTAPKQCLPNIFLLASFPTSGHELTHSVMERATGVLNTSFYGESGKGRAVLLVGGTGRVIYAEEPLCHGGVAAGRLPIGGLPTLTKTHYPTNAEACGTPNFCPEHSVVDGTHSMLPDLFRAGVLGGIVVLTRNPGDHLLRNHFRWFAARGAALACDRNKLSCFYSQARNRSCAAVGHPSHAHAHAWVKLYQYWSESFAPLPRMTVRYEEVSDPQLAPGLFKRLIDFVVVHGGPRAQQDARLRDAAAFAKAMALVRKPEYEHGTLLRDVCGEGAARNVAHQTAAASKALGYAFNMSTAVWTLAAAPAARAGGARARPSATSPQVVPRRKPVGKAEASVYRGFY